MKFFGTDGIRGEANKHPMTPEVALQLGKAVATHLDNPTVVVGKDTRLSGYLFEHAVTAGLLAAGAKVFLVGPLPTPAIAHITKSFGADVGIMITASHNPASHNGFKLFNKEGYKLPDAEQERIEELMHDNLKKGSTESDKHIGKARRIEDARGRYIEFAKATIKNTSLAGFKVVIDCANGAAYSVAPTIYAELGAEVIKLNTDPDGENINKDCGALHPEVVAAAVKEHHADVGIALDGDADRIIMVDATGHVIDGDHILAIAATYLHQKGELRGNTVVGTHYTNSGLDACLPPGVNVVRADAGDRYVIEELQKHDWVLGGEKSGHIIFKEHATTGDGTLTGLQILKIMADTKKSLQELAAIIKPIPQTLINIEVEKKIPLEELPKTSALIDTLRQKTKARILVRYSGTENVARVMVEAEDADTVAKEIAKSFQEETQ